MSCKENENSEFNTIEKAIGNQFIIFPRKMWQLTDNKEKEDVGSSDHLQVEKSMALFQNIIPEQLFTLLAGWNKINGYLEDFVFKMT